jgi:transcriptional regulator with XRE-family HTH domain
MSDFEFDADEPSREFVIMVPFPSERLRPASTLLKQHRYRALDIALAASIEPFRIEHDLTLAEVALAVGAANSSLVSQWENGITVPSGLRRRRLIELLEGKRWKLLRGAVIGRHDRSASLLTLGRPKFHTAHRPAREGTTSEQVEAALARPQLKRT